MSDIGDVIAQDALRYRPHANSILNHLLKGKSTTNCIQTQQDAQGKEIVSITCNNKDDAEEIAHTLRLKGYEVETAGSEVIMSKHDLTRLEQEDELQHRVITSVRSEGELNIKAADQLASRSSFQKAQELTKQPIIR